MDYIVPLILVAVILHGIKSIVTQEATISLGKPKAGSPREQEEEQTFAVTGGIAVAIGIAEAAGATLALIFFAIPNLLRH